jgi:dynactin-4
MSTALTTTTATTGANLQHAHSATAQPFVHYHCPCTMERAAPSIDSPSASLNTPASGTLTAKSLPLNIDVDHPPPVGDFSAQPISRLYFCEECHRLKCNRCVQEDIISYYCPSCLFEVPTASVKGEKNR